MGEEWISVKDSLPKLGFDIENIGSNYVLVYDLKNNMKGVGYYDNDYGCWIYNFNGYDECSNNYITHWMPFPDTSKLLQIKTK